MIKAIGYAAKHSFSRLKLFEFERREADAHEVEIAILYCGVCHSDIHQVRNEWSNTVYPCLPGHEIVGRITRVGGEVTRHSVGDMVGVGCMIDSCGACAPCKNGDENYCEGPNSWLATYNGPQVPAEKVPGALNTYERDNTFGGFSNVIVVDQNFVLKIPTGLRPEAAAPLLCAGVTTFSPMRHWGVGPNQRIGIVGFGGLGSIAAKIAAAMGAQVTVFTSHKDKLESAQRLGVHGVLEDDKDALAALKNSFDFILSTIPEKHDINPFIELLKRDCTIVVVGALEPMASVNHQQVAFHRKQIAGSLIGNLADTQQVLQFCADHQIAPDIQVIDIVDVNDAFKRIVDGDVRFRYVIDMASLNRHHEVDSAQPIFAAAGEAAVSA